MAKKWKKNRWKNKQVQIVKVIKPYCFLSYSSKEPHIKTLIPCVWLAFAPHYDLKLTPTGLASGAGQLKQIMNLAEGCAFAVVALDGLRPNVVFEYGLLEALHRPVILLKEKDATVDVRSYFSDAASLGVQSPKLQMDSHFSNVKDLTYTEWDREKPDELVKILWQEYRKKEDKIDPFVAIEDAHLWST
ncbi:MAG: hypothetical protein ACLP3K_03490 [Candidatus Acidiferrales bacterium]